MKSSFRRSLLAAGLVACALAAHAQTQAKPAAAAASADKGIVSNPEYEKAGLNAAHAWLLLLDRKDWGTAWDASSAVFRQTVPLGNWMDAIPKVRQPFGPLVERLPGEAIYKTSLPGRPDGQYVTVMFLSQYKNQKVQELITTVREGDGRWRVTGYSPKQVP